MTEASFITKKRDAEYQVQRLMVVKDLGESQTTVQIYEKDNKIGFSKVSDKYCNLIQSQFNRREIIMKSEF